MKWLPALAVTKQSEVTSGAEDLCESPERAGEPPAEGGLHRHDSPPGTIEVCRSPCQLDLVALSCLPEPLAQRITLAAEGFLTGGGLLQLPLEDDGLAKLLFRTAGTARHAHPKRQLGNRGVGGHCHAKRLPVRRQGHFLAQLDRQGARKV